MGATEGKLLKTQVLHEYNSPFLYASLISLLKIEHRISMKYSSPVPIPFIAFAGIWHCRGSIRARMYFKLPENSDFRSLIRFWREREKPLNNQEEKWAKIRGTCVCAQTHRCTHTCTYTCTQHAHAHNTHMHMQTHAHTSTHTGAVHACMHAHTNTHSHTHPAIQQLVFHMNLLPLIITSFSQQIDDGHLIRA